MNISMVDVFNLLSKFNDKKDDINRLYYHLNVLLIE